jgi:hypothetical protein
VGPRAGLYGVEKRKFLILQRLELVRRPARSQSVYRLRYPNLQVYESNQFIYLRISFLNSKSVCRSEMMREPLVI